MTNGCLVLRVITSAESFRGIGSEGVSGKVSVSRRQRAYVCPDSGSQQIEPIAALEHADHRRRRDALAQRRGPVGHVFGREREPAQRIAGWGRGTRPDL